MRSAVPSAVTSDKLKAKSLKPIRYQPGVLLRSGAINCSGVPKMISFLSSIPSFKFLLFY